MIWEKPPLDQDRARALASRYDLDLLTASILARRGLGDPQDMMFLMLDDPLFQHNPFLFVEMEDAVDRILGAREEGEKVLVFGDRDVDGITSTALLVEALQDMGIEVSWRLPMGDEPYSITIEAVEDFAAADGSLIITVDCGISSVREIDRARELGIDTIIVDHHLPPEEIPRAYAVINPKVEDSGYPFRDLAGCAVASKLVWALRLAETEFYNAPLTLLNIRPGNNTYVLEAVLMQNLEVQDRLVENLVPGIVEIDRTRLGKFFGGQILVYDAKPQEEMLRRIFGRDANIGLIDLAPKIGQILPVVRGKSLLRLRELSRLGRFREDPLGEIDVLINLFISWVIKSHPKLADGYSYGLDLVAIGTVADMMPIRDENRLLVKSGLKLLNSPAPRDGLLELLRAQNLLGKPLGSREIAWQIGPAINATGRMGEPDKAARLLLSKHREERESLAQGVVELNRMRKKIGDELWDLILPEARTSFEQNGEKFILVCNDRLHRGITGILASRLANNFDVPAAVCAVLEDKIVGSLRSARGYGVLHFLEACGDIFHDYGGHDFAGGFNLPVEDLPRLEQRLEELLPEIKLARKDEEKILIDAELPPSYLKPEIQDVLDFFAPHGEDNPPLTFLTQGALVETVELIGKGEPAHTKLLIRAGAHSWPAVFWNSAERLGRDFAQNDRVSLVYRIGKNYFQNKETLQLTIVDIKRCP